MCVSREEKKRERRKKKEEKPEEKKPGGFFLRRQQRHRPGVGPFSRTPLYTYYYLSRRLHTHPPVVVDVRDARFPTRPLARVPPRCSEGKTRGYIHIYGRV